MNVPTHNCKASGCTRRIRTEFFMCPFHWRMVPKEIQVKVYAAYNAFRDATEVGLKETRAASAALKKAQQEAIDAVGGPPSGPRSA